MSSIAAAAVLIAAGSLPSTGGQDGAHEMRVFKTSTCGCCRQWVDIMSKAGFSVTVKDVADIDPVKKMAMIPDQLQSCHTAKVGSYIIEGHVPVSTIRRLLAEKPMIRGIAVPGMPFGSPGMGHDPNARYDVMTLPNTSSDKAEIYEKIRE
ncbi:MAG: DUF411 domain-containing protein [Geminicoccales bacterium]